MNKINMLSSNDNTISSNDDAISINDTISINDMAILYGFSLFETFLTTKEGHVFLLDKHIKRLFDSMSYFHFETDFTQESLKKYILKYIKKNNANNKLIRITVTPGNKSKNLSPSIIITMRDNPYTDSVYIEGLKLTVSKVVKNESSIILRHKTGNYLENYLELKSASKSGFDDVLFLNLQNCLTETAKCNIFFVKNGLIHTPALDCGLLPGIIRNWVKEQCETLELPLPLKEDFYVFDDLKTADEIFITNSALGIAPVTSIFCDENTKYNIGKITRMLLNKYNENLINSK